MASHTHDQPPTTLGPDRTSPSLLRLPPHIRHRIYRFTGVARFDSYAYTYHLDGRKESRIFRSADGFNPPLGPDPRRRQLPPDWFRRLSKGEDETGRRPGLLFSGLLLTCRVVYAEVAALLYSSNRFVIFYARQRSLAPLRALSPTALASLATLKIVLNESACHQPMDSMHYPPRCCRDTSAHGLVSSKRHCAEHHGGQHGHPLLEPGSAMDPGAAKLSVQAMLLEWRDTATYMSSRVGTGSLALSLVCDFDPRHEYTLEAAQLATAPLALLPPLRDCQVRLSADPCRPLQRLAEDAVLQARPNSSPLLFGPPRTRSPLMRLPPELRHKILEYTDLVTPWGEVTWSRSVDGYQLVRPLCQMDLEYGICPPHILNGCRLTRCCSCNCGPLYNKRPHQYGCFCRRRHSGFSLACQCWAPPTSLFLICRTLREDAEFVFFANNRFIVCDGDPSYPWLFLRDEILDPEAYPFERFAASKFLREIVPAHCLTHLRFLELVFPPYDSEIWPQLDHSAQLDWRETIRWLRDKIKAPALTIRFVMADFDTHPPHDRETLTQEEGRAIVYGWARIMDAFSPLARADGLGGFYVQVSFPLRWTHTAKAHIAWRGNQWLPSTDKRLKEQCERGVRGIQKGAALPPCTKPEPSKSTWQRLYQREALEYSL